MVMKRLILQFFQWCLAIFLAFLLINIILFKYEKPAGWIDRSNAATDSIWNPGSTIVHGTEGYGVYTVDSKGYLNSSIPSGGGILSQLGLRIHKVKK